MINLAIYLDDVTLNTIQLNAILAANKIIFGWINILGIGVLLYVLFHHFGRTKDVLTQIRLSIMGQLWISAKDKEKIKQELQN